MKKRLGRSPDFSDAVVMGWREAMVPDAFEVQMGGSRDDLNDVRDGTTTSRYSSEIGGGLHHGRGNAVGPVLRPLILHRHSAAALST